MIFQEVTLITFDQEQRRKKMRPALSTDRYNEVFSICNRIQLKAKKFWGSLSEKFGIYNLRFLANLIPIPPFA